MEFQIHPQLHAHNGIFQSDKKIKATWKPCKEQAELYDNLFCVASSRSGIPGTVSGKAAVEFFSTSGLPRPTLRLIWSMCDPFLDGSLDKPAFFGAMRLIALAQNKNDHDCISIDNLYSTWDQYVPPPFISFSPKNDDILDRNMIDIHFPHPEEVGLTHNANALPEILDSTSSLMHNSDEDCWGSFEAAKSNLSTLGFTNYTEDDPFAELRSSEKVENGMIPGHLEKSRGNPTYSCLQTNISTYVPSHERNPNDLLDFSAIDFPCCSTIPAISNSIEDQTSIIWDAIENDWGEFVSNEETIKTSTDIQNSKSANPTLLSDNFMLFPSTETTLTSSGNFPSIDLSSSILDFGDQKNSLNCLDFTKDAGLLEFDSDMQLHQYSPQGQQKSTEIDMKPSHMNFNPVNISFSEIHKCNDFLHSPQILSPSKECINFPRNSVDPSSIFDLVMSIDLRSNHSENSTSIKVEKGSNLLELSQDISSSLTFSACESSKDYRAASYKSSVFDQILHSNEDEISHPFCINAGFACPIRTRQHSCTTSESANTRGDDEMRFPKISGFIHTELYSGENGNFRAVFAPRISQNVLRNWEKIFEFTIRNIQLATVLIEAGIKKGLTSELKKIPQIQNYLKSIILMVQSCWLWQSTLIDLGFESCAGKILDEKWHCFTGILEKEDFQNILEFSPLSINCIQSRRSKFQKSDLCAMSLQPLEAFRDCPMGIENFKGGVYFVPCANIWLQVIGSDLPLLFKA